MSREIKYIGFYDFPDSKIKRVSNLAATSKMDYICEAMAEAGYQVHLISPSWIIESSENRKYIRQKSIQLNNKRITFVPSFSTKTKLARNLKIIFSLSWLFLWLLKKVKRNERILLYHVPWLSTPVRLAKKIKGFKLILEVEEIYGDISVIHPYFHILEKKLIDSADAYLFSTDLLANKLGCQKPFIVIYGAYKTYPQLASPPADGKIHLLYAGIIDTHKAGAFYAVEAARYLPEKYVLHIIGFGEIELLKRKISDVNALNGCQIFYDGCLAGEDYIRYCQQCHIGLSTQSMEGKYLETSFPSKILSYLGMGLNVVSGNIECVKISKVNDVLCYYNDNNICSISTAIKNCNTKSSITNIELIQKLHLQFVTDIKNLIDCHYL